MKKYQIKETTYNLNHAGSKALEDVSLFAIQNNYKVINIKTRRIGNKIVDKFVNQIGYLFDWIRTFFEISTESILLLQVPYRKKNLGRELIILSIKRIKKCKVISVIHDIEELRSNELSKYYKSEFNYMLKISDCLIVHNKNMRDFIITKGYDNSKIIELGIFDYYTNNNNNNNNKDFDKSIIIAGNLNKEKSGYIYKLECISRNFKINLFGPNYNKEKSNIGINYHGVFTPEEITNKLKGDFGLVWDGESLDECSGKMGDYLKYNNPHKTSLYLASGIPVIVWKKSAISEFIAKHNVGICINSLKDINNIFNCIKVEEYNEMVKNVELLSKRLKSGYYIKNALEKAELIINKF